MHGLLLTGGSSSRMGRPKALIEWEGSTLGRRAADALRAVADPVLAVGPAYDTGLEVVDDTHDGPLAAFVAGADALRSCGCVGAIVMAACDVPFIDSDVLSLITSELRESDAVIPVVGGRDQPSVSCYSPSAVDVARALVAEGGRSFREWAARLNVNRLAGLDHLFDVDTPEELERAVNRARSG
jgi:molybdopterin-guanine dinucleotide biosynthesis protein A